MGVLLIDPFNEGQHGAATGKLTGSMNTMTNDFLNPQMGNYIQLHVQALDYIENMISKISGVSPQREAQISANETVGGVERSMQQSSNITELWYILHDDTKKRALEALLETAKYAYRNEKNKSVPYILDDMSIALMQLDGELFNESQYNVHISDMSRDTEIFENLKQLAHASLQNGGSLSLLIDIMKSDSISDVSRKLKDDEETRRLEAQQQAEKEQQTQMQMQQMQVEMAEKQLQVQLAEKEKDRELERLKIENDYQIELLKLQKDDGDLDDNGVEEQIKLGELRLKELKQRMDEDALKSKTLLEKEKIDIEKRKTNMENSRIIEEKRKNLADEQLKSKEIEVKKIAARKKPATSKK